MESSIQIIVDNTIISAEADLPLLALLNKLGFNIPFLCYHPRLSHGSRCSLCVIEVHSNKEWNLQHACSLTTEAGMEIRTSSQRIHRIRAQAARLLLKRGPFAKQEITDMLNHILIQARKAGVTAYSSPDDEKPRPMPSSPSGSDSAEDCDNCLTGTYALQMATDSFNFAAKLPTAESLAKSGIQLPSLDMPTAWTENGEFIPLATGLQEISSPEQVMPPGCILCGLCVQACHQVGKNRLTFLGRGKSLRVSLIGNAGIQENSCGTCKACRRVCPTGFIYPSPQEVFSAKLYRDQ